jgi:hypothetical protein
MPNAHLLVTPRFLSGLSRLAAFVAVGAVALTLVCRHSPCDLHTTTNILTIPELARKGSAPFTPADSVLAQQVGVRGVFSDWPATVTDFARCVGL